MSETDRIKFDFEKSYLRNAASKILQIAQKNVELGMFIPGDWVGLNMIQHGIILERQKFSHRIFLDDFRVGVGEL